MESLKALRAHQFCRKAVNEICYIVLKPYHEPTMESKSLNFCNQYQKCEGIPVMREVAYAKNMT